MNDKLYNQIFLKPRFQFDFEMNSQDLLNNIKAHLLDDKRYKMAIIDAHIIIDVPIKDAHLWSPQLSLEVAELTKTRSKIKGLFGPKPQIWTFFMFIHFVVASAFLISSVMAYSNWSLKNGSIFPIVMLVILPIVWVLLYLVGAMGKSIGKKQMDELKEFTQDLLIKIN
ncbi:GTP-binding protein [Tenacibaculum piscium]|uniref:GTP-binding protein n=1 Tax=Tenacibaculum piscium TaxID=1458515 RepID=UPI001F43992F|nr:GTP-binding protein [Tenacibaculum piscium]